MEAAEDCPTFHILAWNIKLARPGPLTQYVNAVAPHVVVSPSNVPGEVDMVAKVVEDTSVEPVVNEPAAMQVPNHGWIWSRFKDVHMEDFRGGVPCANALMNIGGVVYKD